MNLPELLKIAEAAKDKPTMKFNLGGGRREIASQEMSRFKAKFTAEVAEEIIKRLQEAEKALEKATEYLEASSDPAAEFSSKAMKREEDCRDALRDAITAMNGGKKLLL